MLKSVKHFTVSRTVIRCWINKAAKTRSCTPYIIMIALLGCPSWAYAGPTFKEFTLVNTSTTAADDLTVSFNQPVSTIRSNRIFTNDNPPKDTGNFFSKPPVNATPSAFQIIYSTPTNAQTVMQGYSVKFGAETIAAQIGGGFAVSSPTFFTIGGRTIANSAKLVAANLNLNQDGPTAIVSIATSNPTNDFLFLTSIEVWTGLTQSQALAFDANGNYLVSNLPSVPNLTPADITLSPDESLPDAISLGLLPADSYVVAVYDLADGPDSMIGDATQFGQFVFAQSVVPEPSALALLASGLVLCALIRTRRNTSR